MIFCFIFYTILHTYSLAAWSSVLLEKLTSSQLVKKFPHLMETKVSLQHSQVPNPGMRHQIIFCNMIRFYSEEFFAPHPTPKLEYHPLSADRDCLFNIFAATLHIGGHSSIHNLRTCHAVVTGTHLSWLYCIQWWIYCNKWFRRRFVIMYNKHYCFIFSW